MNRYNLTMTQATIACSRVERCGSVIDIGFGGGSSLQLLLDRGEASTIAGVELSETMLAAAARRFRREIGSGHLLLRLGCIDAIPFPSASFDRLHTINTVYFWPNLVAGMREIARVVRPGGQAVLGFRPLAVMAGLHSSTIKIQLHTIESVVNAMTVAGFINIEYSEERDSHLPYVLVHGTRSDKRIQPGA